MKRLTQEERPGATVPGMKIDRRRWMQGVAAASALLPLAGCAIGPGAQAQGFAPGRRVLVRGGHVVTCDRKLGELAGADVLIDGAKIAAVGRNLAAGDAEVVDAA